MISLRRKTGVGTTVACLMSLVLWTFGDVPGAALAQGSPPLVALLRPTGDEAARINKVFSQALRAAGHEDGRTIRLEEYFAGNEIGEMPRLAQAIVATRPAVVITMGTATSRALKEATSTIAIVAHTGFPVEAGLAASLARPGGNVTGVSVVTNQLDPKRLSLLGEFLPTAKRVALVHDRSVPLGFRDQLEAEARRLGITLDVVDVAKPGDIGPALRLAKSRGAQAANVLASPMLNGASEEVASHARELALPTMCQWREMAEAGCLLSYGPPLLESYRLAVVQMDRILRGANPAELPILQPTHFEFVVNLKTARALGISISPSLLARADEVIE